MKWLDRFWNWLDKPSPSSEAPYRNVVSRRTDEAGEHVVLECGHKVLVTPHKRYAFQCAACKDIEAKGD